MADDLFDKYQGLLTFGIVSTLTLGIAIFSFVVMHDYIFITLNTILENMVIAGTIPALFTGIFEGFINQAVNIIKALDYIWVAIFIGFIYELGFVSYHSKREGYFNVFSALTFGMLIFLFISSILEIITGYVYDIFFNAILQNVTIELTFFNLYIANFTLVNLVVVVICVILNFVDFDNATFFARKNKENIENAGTTEL